jgi:predicted DNA-binding transcriptional regulator YafY
MALGPLDFTPEEQRAISLMMRASRTLPDDMWAVAAVQNLACLYAKIEPLLTDEDKAMVIGVGGYIAFQGRAEMEADIQARMALARARPTNNSPRST